MEDGKKNSKHRRLHNILSKILMYQHCHWRLIHDQKHYQFFWVCRVKYVNQVQSCLMYQIQELLPDQLFMRADVRKKQRATQIPFVRILAPSPVESSYLTPVDLLIFWKVIYEVILSYLKSEQFYKFYEKRTNLIVNVRQDWTCLAFISRVILFFSAIWETFE